MIFSPELLTESFLKLTPPSFKLMAPSSLKKLIDKNKVNNIIIVNIIIVINIINNINLLPEGANYIKFIFCNVTAPTKYKFIINVLQDTSSSLDEGVLGHESLQVGILLSQHSYLGLQPCHLL